MIKYNLVSLFWVSLIAGIFSCSNETTNLNVFKTSFTNEQFNDSVLLQALKDDIYNKTIVSLYYNCQFTDDWTDNTCYTENNPVVSGNLSANYDAGWNQFDKIRKCNLLIKNISSGNILSSTTKQTWKGELLFLRGMIYYYLAQRFGGLPLNSTINAEQNFVSSRRSSLQETYDFIINNFTTAASLLPEFINAEQPSKMAALAMLTRIGLQAAAYVPEKRTAYLKLVTESAEKIIQTKACALDSNYYSLFNDFAKSKTSREMILAVYKNESVTKFAETNIQYLVPNQTNDKKKPQYLPVLKNEFEGWPSRFPSQNLVNAFLIKEENGEAMPWDKTNRYKNFKPHTSFASSILYKNRDNRFYATIVYDSSLYFQSLVLTRDSGNFNSNARADTKWGLSPTGYYYKKFVYENKQRVWASDSTNHHQTIIRLGEVWLNYAEANLLLGNYKKAIEGINQTRKVHGGLPPASFSDKTQIWKLYKNERKVELCLENDRYWSLLRWAKFENRIKIPELEEKIQGIAIDATGKSYTIFDVNPGEKRIFSAKRFLFPVPVSAGDLANNNNTRW